MREYYLPFLGKDAHCLEQPTIASKQSRWNRYAWRAKSIIYSNTAGDLIQRPERADILSVFAGLRPLVGQSRAAKGSAAPATSKLSREHEIHTSPSGLITIIGGKWTTYRKMGEDVVDLAQCVGHLRCGPSRTAHWMLRGAPANASHVHWESTTEDPLAVYGTERP